jgi:hypothetical protein
MTARDDFWQRRASRCGSATSGVTLLGGRRLATVRQAWAAAAPLIGEQTSSLSVAMRLELTAYGVRRRSRRLSCVGEPCLPFTARSQTRLQGNGATILEGRLMKRSGDAVQPSSGDVAVMRRATGRWYDRVLYVGATVGLLILLVLAPVVLALVVLAALNVI